MCLVVWENTEGEVIIMTKGTTSLKNKFDNLSILTMQPRHVHQMEGVEFEVVPASSRVNGSSKNVTGSQKRWHVLLKPATNTGGEFKALEIRGDTVIGCNAGSDDSVDINLAEWKGFERGVSRRHLMIRPGPNKLFIMDLRSTNGTQINGLPLGVGWAYALQDGDLITMGRLHVRVAFVHSIDSD
jgi:hypothetical protein